MKGGIAMLDVQKLGANLSSLRKGNGYSQEKLAQMLSISSQAISKWENGRSLPETSLLPVLAQIFGCTIDEIIMPAYVVDEKIKREKESIVEQQAEYIANRVLQKLEEAQMKKRNVGMDDDAIISAIRIKQPNIGNCEINRGLPLKTGRYISNSIIVTTPQGEIRLIEKIFPSQDKELHIYSILSAYVLTIPQIYHLDLERGILLMEDLNVDYIQGNHFDENNDSGTFIRDNYSVLLHAMANFHAVFWENHNVFEQITLDRRLENRENLLSHINGMEKDYKKYRANEVSGKIPKVWNIFENHIDLDKLDYFHTAINILREKYVELIDKRFHAGKNITVIHGDLHPGNTFISKTFDRSVKFIDMEAVRIGLGTEDLAMLLALHIEPDKQKALPLLKEYHENLCKSVTDYSFDTLLEDYKISIMENMFFTLRLMNRGIFDFSMRDRAMRAFETFVLDME